MADPAPNPQIGTCDATHFKTIKRGHPEIPSCINWTPAPDPQKEPVVPIAQLTMCGLCGRVGTRGFSLRYGDGRAPQTGDWCCTNREACRTRMHSQHRKIIEDTGTIGCSCGAGGWFDNIAGQHAFNEHKANP